MEWNKLAYTLLGTLVIIYALIYKQPFYVTLSIIFITLGILSRLEVKEFAYIIALGVLVPYVLNQSVSLYIIVTILGVILMYYLRSNLAEPLFYSIGIDLLLLKEGPIVQFISLLAFLILGYVVRFDFRPLIVVGISDLIASAYYYTTDLTSLTNSLSQISYFLLLFGTIGIVIENTKIRLPVKVVSFISYIPLALLFSLLGKYEGYYFWTPLSFYFKIYTVLSLWIPGIGYNPVINQLPIVLLGHLLGERWYVFTMIFLSGFLTYISLRLLGFNFKKALIGGFLYQFSSFLPIYSPFIIWYATVPIGIVSLKKFLESKNTLYLALVLLLSILGSSYYLWLPSVIIGSFVINKGKGFSLIPSLILVNSWWLLPYLILSFPNSTFLSFDLMKLGYGTLPLGILLLVNLVIYHNFENDKDLKILTLFEISAIIYSLLQFPYYQLLLPLISFFLIVIALSNLNITTISLKDLTKILILIMLIVSALGFVTNIHTITIPAQAYKASKLISSNTSVKLVYWTANYSLISSEPLSKELNSLVKYIVLQNYSVISNPKYIGFPVILIVYNYSNYIPSSWAVYSGGETLDVINETFNHEVIIQKIIWKLNETTSSIPSNRIIVAAFFENIPSNSTLYIDMNSSTPINPNEIEFGLQYVGFATIINGSKAHVNMTSYKIKLNGSLYELYISYNSLKNITIYINSIYFTYNNKTYYIINPKLPNYNITSEFITGGIKIQLNLTSSFLIKFNLNTSNFSIIINGHQISDKELANQSILLNKGNYTIYLLYKDQKLAYYGVYISILSFMITLVSNVIIKRLKLSMRNK